MANDEIKKREAKIVLAKCPKTKGIYGMRIEERGGDWVRTWAFKVNETRAKHEGFDKESACGTMAPVENYPGCPYCGRFGMAQCGACGKVFCDDGESTQKTCPWCGNTGEYKTVEKLNIHGGRM